LTRNMSKDKDKDQKEEAACGQGGSGSPEQTGGRIFMARQPIFDRQRKVFGYELLFRSGVENYFKGASLDQAASRVISSSSMVFDLDSVLAKRKAFINLTRSVLLSDSVTVLPSASTVVELLETVRPDEEVIEVLRRLKTQGYQIALDDYVDSAEFSPLLRLADIVKVDFLQSTESMQLELVEKVSDRDIRMLAEKVETQEDFIRALDMGYEYFQGYFFARPEMISRKDLPVHQVNALRLLREIHRPSMDFNGLEEVLKHDLALSFKLLRYINSAFFGCRVEIRSVRHALVMLGLREIRKWATLIAVANITADKPQELLVQAVLRARFLENLAPLVGEKERSQDFFLLGLFSLIDAFVDRPIREVLIDLPLAAEIKTALVDGTGRMKDVLDLCTSYERARWAEVASLCAKLGLLEERLPPIYREATEWARIGLTDPDLA